MYSNAISPVAVQSTDNFGGASADSWAQLGGNTVDGGRNIAITSGYYYDATSGYSVYANNGGNTDYVFGSLSQFPFYVSTPQGRGSNTFELYKAYTPSNTYTDALVELYIKAPTASGWVAVQVDYSDSSPSDYYIF